MDMCRGLLNFKIASKTICFHTPTSKVIPEMDSLREIGSSTVFGSFLGLIYGLFWRVYLDTQDTFTAIFFPVGLHEFIIYQMFCTQIFFKYTSANDMFWHIYLGTNKKFFAGDRSVPRLTTYTASTEARICHRTSSSAKTFLTWLIIIFIIIPDRKNRYIPNFESTIW